MWNLEILSNSLQVQDILICNFLRWIYGVCKNNEVIKIISRMLPQNKHIIIKTLPTFYSGYVTQRFEIVEVHCSTIYLKITESTIYLKNDSGYCFWGWELSCPNLTYFNFSVLTKLLEKKILIKNETIHSLKWVFKEWYCSFIMGLFV